MKLQKPKNSNYCAVIAEIKNIIPLFNCDNVVATTLFGFQAIVSKTTQVGDLGVFFPAETQLSDEYCCANNLYRHKELNKDPEMTGYIEDNRRVKAVKFRGHKSSALFMPIDSLAYLNVDSDDFKEGDEFDELKGHEICQKYVVITRGSGKANHQPQPKRFNRVDTKFIPEHFSTDNYFRNNHGIAPEVDIIVTQKLHGTSIRVANTIVKRKKTIRDHVASLFGVKVQETEFSNVFGSKRVIKDSNNPYQQDYYDIDIWTQEGKKLEGLIPENFIVYGELIGYTETGKAIQTGYTYKLPINTCELYIYRVAFVNEKGFVVDLTWDQVKEFCQQRALKHVPEIWRGRHEEFVATEYLDKKLKDIHVNCLELDDNKTVDEGVCVRVDRLTPYILKAKSPIFYEHETALMDKGDVDIENENA